MKKITLLFVLITFLGWGQTTVSYDFGASGAVTGLDEPTPGIALDANIGFGSFKNSGTSNPIISNGQLRLYQNTTKGGSIKIYASNGVTITDVVVHASGTTGPAAFAVDGGSSSPISISSGAYTMSSLSGLDNVEFWCTGSSSSTRVYVDSIEVTYTTGAATPEPDNHVTNFMVSNSTYNSIDLSWTDAVGTNLPTGYFILANTTDSFTNPVDGTPLTEDADLSDGVALVNVLYGVENYSFSGLSAETQYYFAIYPYSNSNNDIDYKTDGVVPTTNVITDESPNFCGFEDFTNSTLGSSYSDGSFTGNNGIIWSYVASRDENGDANNSGINGNAIMLRRIADGSKITSSSAENGIKDFSVKLYKGFTGAGNRQVELFINGVSYGTSDVFDDFNEHVFSVNNINIEGSVIVELRNTTSYQVIVDDISWLCYGSPSTTWNGISWSNGVPEETKLAQIDGNYDTAVDGNISTKKLIIKSGILTINANGLLQIQDELINNLTASNLVIENNGVLLQQNNVNNSGDISVNRESAPMIRLDYTAWSSPVNGQNLLAFSPNTIASRFYTYDYTGNSWSSVDPSSTSFAPGLGYLIRVDNTWSTSVYSPYNGQFIGVPRNGTYNVSAGIGYNLFGNPYPSPIDADTFIADNSSLLTTGALYFWSHAVAQNGSYVAQSNYASYTLAGGVAATAGGAQPDGIIQLGQGFFTDVNSTSTIQFNNAQRLGSSNGQFFKTNTIEKHRLWLSLSDSSNNFNQMMIAYMTGATNGVDFAIDAKLFTNSTSTISSFLNNEKYVIQGRALAFDPMDEVALSFTADVDGTYTINLDNFDGTFGTQDIYLWDKTLNVVHDLKASSYSFLALAGTYNSRFSVIYTSALSNNVASLNANEVLVYNNSGQLKIESPVQAINAYTIYDIQGRRLATANNVNVSSVSVLNLEPKNQFLIIEIQTDKGSVTKKVLF